jgi:hypothetical protein
MFNSAKRSQQIDKEELAQEQRKDSDRRISTDETRFPFIDENCKLVMKDRRTSSRRVSDKKLINNPLKVVGKLFRK